MKQTVPCPACGRRVSLRWDGTFTSHRKRGGMSPWCPKSDKRYEPADPNLTDEGVPSWNAS